MTTSTKKTKDFRAKLAQLPKEDLLELVAAHDPELIKQINRIEWVFENKLSHLNWKDGTQVTGRPLTNQELALLIDEPFELDYDLLEAGISAEQQRQIHLAKDPVTWARSFLDVSPRVYQILILRDPSLRKVLRAGRRLGKALHIDTPIPTPDGWKTMKELEVGDQVFDETGTPCNVTFVTDVQWNRNCYKVHFSDGNSLIADADHQWTVDTKQSRKARGRAQNPQSGPITLTTAEMIDNLYVWCGDKFEVNYSIDVCDPVQYSEKNLPIDPWLFGLWLADGTSCNGRITIGDQDSKEIISRIESLGYTVFPTSSPIQYRVEGLWTALNELGVLKKYPFSVGEKSYKGNGVEKFIPIQYLQGSVDQRMALLQGLMDGDGTVLLNSNCEFSVSNKELASDTYELVQSLGFRATWKECDSKLYGRKVGTRYRINFTPWKPVFTLARKLERQNLHDEPSARQRCRYIVAIEAIDSVPVKCISVDSANSLYLAGKSFIPTHNTFSMAIQLLHYSYTNKDGRCLVVAPMKSHVELIYQELLRIAAKNDVVMNSITRKITSPQFFIQFSNGSTIRFFTSGMKSGGKSDVARGQEAHVIVLDEMDYMGNDDLDALYAMLQKTAEDQPDKLLIGASTPTGRRERFWEWSMSNRFKEFWFPSYVNPFFSKEQEEEFREQYSSSAYRHEIEADWGEDSEGVYPRRFVDRAFIDPPWNYVPEIQSARSFHIIGVDWDKYGAGTNIVVLEACNENYEDQRFAGKVRLAYREEIDKSEYTLTTAVDRIIELNKMFQPKHIYVDRGFGEVQVELLTKYGVENPGSRMRERIRGVSFAESIEVRDPYTKLMIKKEIKPFMVDNLRQYLEREQLLFPASDEEMYMQLISYVVVKLTSSGRPVFEAGGSAVDHAHDALLLALLAITQNYGEFSKGGYTTNTESFSNDFFVSKLATTTNDEDVPKPALSGRVAAMSAKKSFVQRSGSRINRRMF